MVNLLELNTMGLLSILLPIITKTKTFTKKIKIETFKTLVTHNITGR